jgi:hypothetical protein
MSRRIAVLVLTTSLLFGATVMFAPAASSADLGWTTLTRHCWTIRHEGDRLRGCTSVKGGTVDGQFMIRSRCRVKMFTFEPTYILVRCVLLNGNYEDVAVNQVQRSGITALTVKTPLVRCDPTDRYYGLMIASFKYPDGSYGDFGLAKDWVSCPPPS